MEHIWIGTSGWSYTGWAGAFYPARLSSSRWLAYYASQFPTVEINATFYRLPSLKMVEHWSQRAPGDFIFAVKGSRYLTHMKKLVGVGPGLEQFFERIAPLDSHTGPILWQLPPTLTKDVKRLDAFLEQVPKNFRHAVEFRHPSWIANDVFEVLRRHNAACVWISSWLMPRDFTVTADFLYLRFHGLDGAAAHNYTKAELAPWAHHLVKAAEEDKPAFVYFNNDVNARAPSNARMLMEMVGPHAVRPFGEVPATGHARKLHEPRAAK